MSGTNTHFPTLSQANEESETSANNEDSALQNIEGSNEGNDVDDRAGIGPVAGHSCCPGGDINERNDALRASGSAARSSRTSEMHSLSSVGLEAIKDDQGAIPPVGLQQISSHDPQNISPASANAAVKSVAGSTTRRRATAAESPPPQISKRVSEKCPPHSPDNAVNGSWESESGSARTFQRSFISSDGLESLTDDQGPKPDDNMRYFSGNSSGNEARQVKPAKASQVTDRLKTSTDDQGPKPDNHFKRKSGSPRSLAESSVSLNGIETVADDQGPIPVVIGATENASRKVNAFRRSSVALDGLETIADDQGPALDVSMGDITDGAYGRVTRRGSTFGRSSLTMDGLGTITDDQGPVNVTNNASENVTRRVSMLGESFVSLDGLEAIADDRGPALDASMGDISGAGNGRATRRASTFGRSSLTMDGLETITDDQGPTPGESMENVLGGDNEGVVKRSTTFGRSSFTLDGLESITDDFGPSPVENMESSASGSVTRRTSLLGRSSLSFGSPDVRNDYQAPARSENLKNAPEDVAKGVIRRASMLETSPGSRRNEQNLASWAFDSEAYQPHKVESSMNTGVGTGQFRRSSISSRGTTLSNNPATDGLESVTESRSPILVGEIARIKAEQTPPDTATENASNGPLNVSQNGTDAARLDNDSSNTVIDGTGDRQNALPAVDDTGDRQNTLPTVQQQAEADNTDNAESLQGVDYILPVAVLVGPDDGDLPSSEIQESGVLDNDPHDDINFVSDLTPPTVTAVYRSDHDPEQPADNIPVVDGVALPSPDEVAFKEKRKKMILLSSVLVFVVVGTITGVFLSRDGDDPNTNASSPPISVSNLSPTWSPSKHVVAIPTLAPSRSEPRFCVPAHTDGEICFHSSCENAGCPCYLTNIVDNITVAICHKCTVCGNVQVGYEYDCFGLSVVSADCEDTDGSAESTSN